MSTSVLQGDDVYTPLWVAADMVAYFRPAGQILDPCRGPGVFLQVLPRETSWCEVKEGRDFFEWTDHVDWVIGNPPYSQTRRWFRHSYQIADHLLYLVPLRNIVSGFGFIQEMYAFGGIKAIRCYGTGNHLGFPMGNAIAAIHLARDYQGTIDFSISPRVRDDAFQGTMMFDLDRDG